MSRAHQAVTGLILAGGEGRRMDGRDKGLAEVGGRPLVAWVAERLCPQVDVMLVSANRNLERYAALGCSVVSDTSDKFPGPLAGFAAGLAHATTPWLAVAPCDSPFIPTDMVQRLIGGIARSGAEIAVAVADGRLQPVIALVQVSLRADLDTYLASGEKRIAGWFRQHALVEVEFSAHECANINTPIELAAAERLLESA